MTEQNTAWDWEDWDSFDREMCRPVFTADDFALGPPPALGVYEVRDDEDYSDPTRRILVTAPSPEAAEAMWDDAPTADNVYAREVRLKGRHLKIPGEPRVLYSAWLTPVSDSQAA
jgi:hypothetical protein